MSGCRPMAPVRLPSLLGGEFMLAPQEGGWVCDIRGTPIFVEGASSSEEADAIRCALRVFPDPFLKRFLSGLTFIAIPRGEFEKVSVQVSQGFDPRMGIKTAGRLWYLRKDLLEAGREGTLTHRLWYAVAARVADELEGEEGFDRSRFQASFNRYLATRLGNPLVMPWLAVDFFLPGVDPLYQTYLDKLAESPDFDRKTLRELFREAREEAMQVNRPPSRMRLLLGQEQPWVLKQFYEEFVSEGITWRLWGEDTLSLGLQSAASRERPESSHRLNLHYTSSWLNGRMGAALGGLFPGLSPTALWAPGVVGSYETRTAGGGKHAAFLVGSLLDVGAQTLWGEFAIHSYIGVPLTAQVTGGDAGKGGQRPFSPEWEVGINYRGLDGALFVGSMCSVTLFDPNRLFMGFVLRWKG